ncbi:MAG: glycosyltransferase family A protein, partial [Vulcanisaeta sp.]
MKILVGIPTYSNSRFGYTIRQTLEALVNQSFKDFRVLVVYKPSPGDKTLDVVDEFKDKLDIEVKIQSDGYFEEALNMIYEVAKDYDITLTTDDDAIPTKTWIEEHIKFHKNHEKIGISQGIVIPSRNYCYESWYLPRSLIGYHKPLLKELNDYSTIVNDMGLLACKGKWRDYRFNNRGYVLSIEIRGVNMSLKSRSYIDGFALPGYTKRGLHNETLLALHYVRQGLHSALFNGGIVNHLKRDSLSRPRSP